MMMWQQCSWSAAKITIDHVNYVQCTSLPCSNGWRLSFHPLQKEEEVSKNKFKRVPICWYSIRKPKAWQRFVEQAKDSKRPFLSLKGAWGWGVEGGHWGRGVIFGARVSRKAKKGTSAEAGRVMVTDDRVNRTPNSYFLPISLLRQMFKVEIRELEFWKCENQIYSPICSVTSYLHPVKFTRGTEGTCPDGCGGIVPGVWGILENRRGVKLL